MRQCATNKAFTHALLILALAVPGAYAQTAPPAGAFIDVTQALGINLTPKGDRSDWGHGCVFVDYDGDGTTELYVVMGKGQPNRFFQLEPDGTYTNIAPDIGCADGLNGRAAIFADYDNDGDQDFFLSNHNATNRLYQNDGTGVFYDVAAVAGVNDVSRAHAAGWADYNNDGYLDIFVCVYGTTGVPDANLLYESNGDGTFTERAQDAGVADADKPALAMTWIDYDNDGDLDIYIAYDKYRGNTMYRNNGDGTFTDRTAASNTDLAFNAMGVAVGDFDNNGYFDMYITNTMEGNELLQNNGNGTFSKVGAALGVLVFRTGWGCSFLDYDNDGDDDLYVINWAFTAGSAAAGNVFFRNDAGVFVNKSAELGVDETGSGFALTVGDYNNDGYLDMFVNNQGSPSVFYENAGGTNKWVKIKTVGTTSNRDGIGARVRVTAGALVQHKDVRSGSSYLSQVSPELDFGLARSDVIDEVMIVWPSGIVDTHTNVDVNKTYIAVEGGDLRPPLPAVVIAEFAAASLGGRASLEWEIETDGEIQGFRIYRGTSDQLPDQIVSGALPLGAGARSFVDVGVQPGRDYGYVLAVVHVDGSEVKSPVVSVTIKAAVTALSQNSPNPFNPTTTIDFSLSGQGQTRLDVFDVAGRFVVTLANGVLLAGPQSVAWDGRDANGARVSSGVYFYRLQSSAGTLTRKMILLK